jgi:hypothetical protein
VFLPSVARSAKEGRARFVQGDLQRARNGTRGRDVQPSKSVPLLSSAARWNAASRDFFGSERRTRGAFQRAMVVEYSGA